jgi:hypothetical protein
MYFLPVLTHLGLAISDKKLFCGRQLVCSGGIPAVPWNRKLSEFCSEPVRRGEKYSEFCTVEQKYKQTHGIPI